MYVLGKTTVRASSWITVTGKKSLYLSNTDDNNAGSSNIRIVNKDRARLSNIKYDDIDSNMQGIVVGALNLKGNKISTNMEDKVIAAM